MHFVYFLFSIRHQLQFRENFEKSLVQLFQIEKILLLLKQDVPHQLTDRKIHQSIVSDRPRNKYTSHLEFFANFLNVVFWR